MTAQSPHDRRSDVIDDWCAVPEAEPLRRRLADADARVGERISVCSSGAASICQRASTGVGHRVDLEGSPAGALPPALRNRVSAVDAFLSVSWCADASGDAASPARSIFGNAAVAALLMSRSGLPRAAVLAVPCHHLWPPLRVSGSGHPMALPPLAQPHAQWPTGRRPFRGRSRW
jgi:hypothetical protein